MEELKEYLLNNIEVLEGVVREINSWDGSLDWLDVFNNDEEFFEIFYHNKTVEAVRAVCYGNYNYMDDYVRINAYGNLESCNAWEYKEELTNYIDEIIESLIEEKENLYIDDSNLIELLEKI